MEKHCEKFDRKTIKMIGFLTFFIGFGQSMLIYVMSSYFKEASGTDNVGIFYLIAYTFEIFLLLNLHKLVSSIGYARTFLFMIFIKIPFLLILSILNLSIPGIVTMIGYIVFSNISWAVLDMILETCSIDRMSGRIRGLHLTILNTGFIFGPLLSTYLLKAFGYQGVFIALIILYSFIFIMAIFKLRNFQHSVEKRLSVIEIMRKISRRKNVQKIYYVSFVLEFFYALMIIYTPIYLVEIGLGWDKIGIIFTFMLLPFVLLQFPIGYLADKEIGEKELIIMSLFITALAASSLFWINSSSIIIWSAVLFLTRVGAAGLEILRDSYFYKRIDCEDIDLIDFFRTARPMAYIVGSVFSTFFIFLFPLKTVFILISLVVFSAVLPAWKLVDNKSERELALKI